MKFSFAVAGVSGLLLAFSAIAEPMNAGVIKLVGKTQSSCLQTAESALKSVGMTNVLRGKNSNGEFGPTYWAADKPYYAVVTCEGDIAFIAVSGPQPEKRGEFWKGISHSMKQ